VRHVAVALNALEETESGSALIIHQLQRSWLGTLLNLVGETSPGGKPPRLPQKRLN
jgi:hypothetical protein